MVKADSRNQTNKPKKKMITFSVLGALLLMSIGIGGYLVNKDLAEKKKNEMDPIVAEVAGEKVRLSEYKERLFAASGGFGTPSKPVISQATEAIKEPVLNELVELKIVDKELKKRNINIPDPELLQEAKSTFKEYDAGDTASQKAFRDYVRLRVGKNKLLSDIATWKEGYTLYCYFDRANQSDMRNKPAEAASLRAKQEPYAKEYCTKTKERLEKGESSYKDELEKLKADPVIGAESWKPYVMPFGREIVKEEFSRNNYHPAYNLYDRLLELNNEKNKFYLLTMQEPVEKPKESRTLETKNPKETKGATEVGGSQLSSEEKASQSQGTKDAMYMLVYIQNGSKGETNDFTQWLKDRWGEYKVKTYIERIKT